MNRGQSRFSELRRQLNEAFLEQSMLAVPSAPTPSEEVNDAVKWIGERLASWGIRTVNSTTPAGFEAYARLLHPAWIDGNVPAPWSRVAQWSGRPLAGTMSFDSVAERPDGVKWDSVGARPKSGELTSSIALDLARVLVEYTATPAICWFCVWTGWGDLNVGGVKIVDITRSITASGRQYALFCADVQAITTVLGIGRRAEFRTPSFWWPDDHAWFVSTEIDAESTYVAGTTMLMNRLLRTPNLEVLPASLADPLDGEPAS